jgi:hypothetical protein
MNRHTNARVYRAPKLPVCEPRPHGWCVRRQDFRQALAYIRALGKPNFQVAETVPDRAEAAAILAGYEGSDYVKRKSAGVR